MVPASTIEIERAAAMIRAGKLVAFPTETVYGLGANALDASAVARIFEVKNRPRFDPLIVHIASIDMARECAEFSALAERLAKRFWPGPLTLVLSKHESIPDIVTAGLTSVGVRIPDHPVALDLIRRAGVAIAAPSANPFGFVSPTRAEHVAEQLGGRIDMILDGGPCRVGVESTVLSLLNDQPLILRHGGVSQEILEAELGPLCSSTTSANGIARSPGQELSHYAPGKPVVLFTDDAELPKERGRASLLAFSHSRPGFAVTEILSPRADLIEAATNLFAALRKLGAAPVDVIYAEDVPEHGLGRAIMDRLRRAAMPENRAES